MAGEAEVTEKGKAGVREEPEEEVDLGREEREVGCWETEEEQAARDSEAAVRGAATVAVAGWEEEEVAEAHWGAEV